MCTVPRQNVCACTQIRVTKFGPVSRHLVKKQTAPHHTQINAMNNLPPFGALQGCTTNLMYAEENIIFCPFLNKKFALASLLLR